MTLTIDCVYEQGYIPDQEEVEYPIKEDLWNTESNIVRNTVKNNLHKQIFYEFRFLSANGEGMDDDRETETTWYLDADDMHEQSRLPYWEHGKLWGIYQ